MFGKFQVISNKICDYVRKYLKKNLRIFEKFLTIPYFVIQTEHTDNKSEGNMFKRNGIRVPSRSTVLQGDPFKMPQTSGVAPCKRQF